MRNATTAVLQVDTRFCTQPPDYSQTWWAASRMTARWAARHGYLHLCVCLHSCIWEGAGSDPAEHRMASWCKLQAAARVLQQRQPRVHRLLVLDSDAYVNWTSVSLDDLERDYVPAEQLHAGVAFFGCNAPYNTDARHRPWPWKAANAKNGPANAGVALYHNKPLAHALLSSWFERPSGYWRADPYMNVEQGALWELWAQRPDLARAMHVLTSNADGKCMRTMPTDTDTGARDQSPIVHLDHFSSSKAWFGRRFLGLGRADVINADYARDEAGLAPAMCQLHHVPSEESSFLEWDRRKKQWRAPSELQETHAPKAPGYD
jgi:hypothetical protein